MAEDTKKEVEEIISKFDKIDIPFGIEAVLAKKITDAFDKAGIYYHVLTRIKERDSIKRKLEKKYSKYKNNNEKMQDLIGIKFLFYFVDDLKIALRIVKGIYHLEDVSATETTKDSFTATNRNYVCKLPEDTMISDEFRYDLNNCMIDDTFEVQFKTMFFHGWHETEHDLRYKNEELWRMHGDSMYRKLNRILASLELCDDSLIGVFDKLAYRTYQAVKKEYDESENKDDYRVDPLVLEKMAQAHFRLRMDMEFHAPEIDEETEEDNSSDAVNLEIYDNSLKAEHILTMKEYFACSFKIILDKENKTDAEVKAGELADKAIDTFLTAEFLRLVEKYDRAGLMIEGFLSYKNHIDIDIYNICALIYTGKSYEGEQDAELVQYLKKHLIRQYKSSKTTCKNIIRRNKDKAYKNNYKSYSPIRVKRCEEYPTYQCYADVFPAENPNTVEELFQKVFMYVAKWMDDKIENDNSSDARKRLHEYAIGEKKIDTEAYNEPLLETKGYDFRVLYLKEERTCAFRLTEPDNQYKNKSSSGMMYIRNRTFITDASIKMVGEGKEGHVELAVRTSCKEPVDNYVSAEAFRTSFIMSLCNKRDELKKNEFTVTEHGIPVRFKWQSTKKVIHDVTAGEKDELLNNPSRQLPVVVISEKVKNENPEFGIASLTSSLSGYGYVVVEKDSDDDKIRICYPEKFKSFQGDERVVGPTDLDKDKDNPDSGEKTYVYAWQEIADIVRKNTIKNRAFSFGGVKLYRELKDAYYKLEDESVEVLKKRVENLERALNELGG